MIKVLFYLFILSNPLWASLKLVTYNVGLFKIPIIQVPLYSERLSFLAPTLAKTVFDVLALQEVWHKREKSILEDLARELDCYFFVGNYRTNGLAILVKREIVKKIIFREHLYKAQQWYEPLLGFRKGALVADLELFDGTFLTVVNTHLTAVVENHVREKQAREIVNLSGRDFLIIMGDLNMTPEFNEDTYAILMEGSYPVDTFREFNPKAFGYTYSKKSNSIARKKRNSDKETRLDYIIVRSVSAPVSIVKSEVVFQEDLPHDACQVEIKDKNYPCKLSDHYGVASEIEFPL